MGKYLMAGLLALFVVLPAHAANITYNEKCDDGTNNCKFILINGDVMPGDAKKFSDLMATTTTRKLYLHSPGGLLDEGLAIAKVVHQQHNFETLVDKPIRAFRYAPSSGLPVRNVTTTASRQSASMVCTLHRQTSKAA